MQRIHHSCWRAMQLLLLLLLTSLSSLTAASHTVSRFALSIGNRLDPWAKKSQSQRRSGVLFSEQPRGGASTAVKSMSSTQMAAFNLFSGGAAGTVASCLTNPLDVIKTQLQSSSAALNSGSRGHPLTVAKQIMLDDGLSGFWRGLPPTLIGIIPSRSIYFYAYQKMKHFLGRFENFSEGSPPNALIAGLTAGIAANTLTNPIWMVRTRMQLHADKAAGQRAYTGYFDAISTIYRTEGLAGYFKGISASYWGCSEGACQFLLYEDFKKRLLNRINTKRAAQGLHPTNYLPNSHYFWCAAASKLCATIATYPHEVARTRLREQAREGIFKYHGMWQTLALVAKEEGVSSMYAGMGVHLMKVVPNSAFMFLTYEIVKSWLGEFQVAD